LSDKTNKGKTAGVRLAGIFGFRRCGNSMEFCPKAPGREKNNQSKLQ
jgi:hypothetical protein